MELEQFKDHRAKRKWTALVITKKTIPSQLLPTSQEGSLHFWRASQLSLPLHSVRVSAVNEQVTLQTLWVFHPQLSWLSLFISHTGISSPTHTLLSLWPEHNGFLRLPSKVAKGRCWCLPPAISVTDVPHCHTTPQLLLLQPVLFCDWNFLFLNGQCDFSQSHTLCSAFSRQKLENNDKNYLKKEMQLQNRWQLVIHT